MSDLNDLSFNLFERDLSDTMVATGLDASEIDLQTQLPGEFGSKEFQLLRNEIHYVLSRGKHTCWDFTPESRLWQAKNMPLPDIGSLGSKINQGFVDRCLSRLY